MKRRDQTSLFDNSLTSKCNSAVFLYSSSVMKRINYEITKVARMDVPVLITGETGVGKDLAAKLIHLRSSRVDKPFEYIPIKNLCEGLLESELFGYEKGAFTGASENRIGKLEGADKGTIYLPEISSLSNNTQLKLLEFMQYSNIERVGGGAQGKIKLNVRIIMASNENLEKLVTEGKIRKDFYYRIKVFTINIPPLRERLEDIEILAKHFLELYSIKMTGEKYDISNNTIALLKSHKWDGNIRELENSIIDAIVRTEDRVLEPEDFDLRDAKTYELRNGDKLRDYKTAEISFKKDYFRKLLVGTNYNVTKAAEIAGITRQALHNIIKSLGLHTDLED